MNVFPTHVGVFPISIWSSTSSRCLPHARGGVSSMGSDYIRIVKSSPRTWGCFSGCRISSFSWYVFPTHVGVFLAKFPAATSYKCLPHARGGVSQAGARGQFWRQSSPRTWGCFSADLAYVQKISVFPTHVGVFLMDHLSPWQIFCLPHARGGVSEGERQKEWKHASSPRTWGCFRLRYPAARTGPVFPTHVGVFPAALSGSTNWTCLPHARGGVSDLRGFTQCHFLSSPRTWGCF